MLQGLGYGVEPWSSTGTTATLGSIVVNGQLAPPAARPARALTSDDLPGFGMPAIPTITGVPLSRSRQEAA